MYRPFIKPALTNSYPTIFAKYHFVHSYKRITFKIDYFLEKTIVLLQSYIQEAPWAIRYFNLFLTKVKFSWQDTWNKDQLNLFQCPKANIQFEYLYCDSLCSNIEPMDTATVVNPSFLDDKQLKFPLITHSYSSYPTLPWNFSMICIMS